jgi:hypothetical protein
MGQYIDFEDVADRYRAFAEKVGAGPNEAEGYIQGAESEIDSALSNIYPTPFTPGSCNVPYLIRDIAIDLTYWKAVAWQNEKLGTTLRTYIDKRILDIQTLKSLLVNSGGGMYPQGPTFAAATSDGKRSNFGIDDPVNWSVSSAWQDSFAADREGDGWM